MCAGVMRIARGQHARNNATRADALHTGGMHMTYAYAPTLRAYANALACACACALFLRIRHHAPYTGTFTCALVPRSHTRDMRHGTYGMQSRGMQTHIFTCLCAGSRANAPMNMRTNERHAYPLRGCALCVCAGARRVGGSGAPVITCVHPHAHDAAGVRTRTGAHAMGRCVFACRVLVCLFA